MKELHQIFVGYVNYFEYFNYLKFNLNISRSSI